MSCATIWANIPVAGHIFPLARLELLSKLLITIGTTVRILHGLAENNIQFDCNTINKSVVVSYFIRLASFCFILGQDTDSIYLTVPLSPRNGNWLPAYETSKPSEKMMLL